MNIFSCCLKQGKYCIWQDMCIMLTYSRVNLWKSISGDTFLVYKCKSRRYLYRPLGRGITIQSSVVVLWIKTIHFVRHALMWRFSSPKVHDKMDFDRCSFLRRKERKMQATLELVLKSWLSLFLLYLWCAQFHQASGPRCHEFLWRCYNIQSRSNLDIDLRGWIINRVSRRNINPVSSLPC